MYNSAVCLLEDACSRFSARPALKDGDILLSYGELREQARRGAAALLGSAPVSGSPVVVCLPKGATPIVCFFAALYAGCPYVPVDPATPLPRMAKILENLRPAHMILTAEMMKALEGSELYGALLHTPDELLACASDDEAVNAAVAAVRDTDPAYIIYTSGSTGAPKGVAVPHRGLLWNARWMKETYGFDENSVCASVAPLHFDLSVSDIFGAVCAGAELVLAPQALLMFPSKLPEFLILERVTSLFAVPAILINIANSGALEGIEMPDFKNLIFGAEAMPTRQLNIWRRALPNVRMTNEYGPTEGTVNCCYYTVDREFSDSETLPIGRACSNVGVLLLVGDREAAVGEEGEICISGPGVALGYWRQPELSEKSFVQNPLNDRFHERIFRTGDMAYINSEGLIMFLGRRDGQIKIKGNRIELGELDAAARCIEGVENACSMYDADRKEIVLFVETKGTLSFRKFNLELKKYIPAYMLPARMLTLEKLPYMSNDKFDRVALRAMLKENDK